MGQRHCFIGAILTLVVGLPWASGAPSTPMAVTPIEHQALAADLAINARGEIALLWVDRSPTLAAAKLQDAHQHHGDHAASSTPPDRHIALTNLYVAISTDGGMTFEKPVKVNTTDGLVWGQAVSRPRIVGTSDNAWHITYAANEVHPQLGKTALTTHYTRSRDGAKTFEPPRRLSALTDQDLSEVIHGGFVSAAAFGAITTMSNDSVAVVWIDTRHMDKSSNSAALYLNVSHDSGNTFEGEKQIFETGVCPCCQAMAVSGLNERFFVGSRGVTSDNYRAATVMSITANGEASVRRDMGGAAWQIEGCPLKPTVITRHQNHVFAAVHSGGETQPGVIFSVSKDNGNTFVSQGLVHPAAAVSDSPNMATNGRSVALVWHAKTSGAWRIFYQFYDLDGVPLGSVKPIESGGGSARSPVVSHTSDGGYLVAWQQDGRIMTAVLPTVVIP